MTRRLPLLSDSCRHASLSVLIPLSAEDSLLFYFLSLYIALWIDERESIVISRLLE